MEKPGEALGVEVRVSYPRALVLPLVTAWLLLDRLARSLSCGTKEAFPGLPCRVLSGLTFCNQGAKLYFVTFSVLPPFLNWEAPWEQELCHLSLYLGHRASHIISTQWMLNEWLNEWSVVPCNWSQLPENISRGRKVWSLLSVSLKSRRISGARWK